MQNLVSQTVINWKSINPEHENYEVPKLNEFKTLNEQDWLDSCNHTGSDLLLLLVNVQGKQEITMGYYYEYDTKSYISGQTIDIKRKYFSDLRYTIYSHEIENVIGWCYHKDSISDVEQTPQRVVN